MNKNDFKNPLIQSGAVLLLVFLLISIVAGSGSQGLWGSIGALISGLFSTILFIIALCIAIVFSIAVIIGIYVAAVSIYSADKGRDLFEQLKTTLYAFYAKVRGTKIKNTASSPETAEPEAESAPAPEPSSPAAPQPARQASTNVAPAQMASLEPKLETINSMLTDLTHQTSGNAEKIAALQRQFDDFSGARDLEGKLNDIVDTHERVSGAVEELSGRIEAGSSSIRQLEQQFRAEFDKIRKELASLHDKTSVPEVVSGILSYIDSPEDRDLITEKAKEAISRGMTYAQTDDFFKSSLPAEVYQELAAHPRLTKDFLRSIKKKF